MLCPVIWGLLSLGPSVAAQNTIIPVPYSMGFEETEAADMTNWVLNPGADGDKCVDQWVVGDATSSIGHRALYISANEGTDATFGVATNVQYAYRDFVLPKGSYEVSFDWCCMGSVDACMYAGVGRADALTLQADNGSSKVPTLVEPWTRELGKMQGNTRWKNASIPLNSNGVSTYRLFFVWSSTNRDTTLAMPIGGCIDNIQICSANCARPEVVTARSTCDSVWVSWRGTSEKYSFEYRQRGKKWSTPVTTEKESYLLENLDEGLYDFRVRGICNEVDTSAYTYLNSYILFCADRHCIDYVNLRDSTHVICMYGSASQPYASRGVIDNEYSEVYNRHMVYWEPDQYDPRTGYKLPTIPQGELASVRLGNRNIYAEGEAIEYKYTVDLENAAILLMKYAVVLEDPGHSELEQPRFTLEILDKDGNLISPTCGRADFAADAKREGWHTYVFGNHLVTWKEWTTIGLNLSEMVLTDGSRLKTGDVLTIRLTTRDCTLTGHFGYAYFTLGCAAAKLYATGCGDNASMAVQAPEGFRYEWYDKNGNIVSRDREYSIPPTDTTTYRCRLIYTENEECDFSLYTSVRPRFPVAEFGYSYEPSECENKVRFTNRSHIMTVFDGDTVHHYDETCEGSEWSFGTTDESTNTNPVYVFPKEGGRFPVTLHTAISGGECADDTTIYVVVPAIGDVENKIDSTICEGNWISNFGRYNAIAESGIYYDSLQTVAGCDSVVILDLKVHPVNKTYLPDTTVCAEVPLCIDGECYMHATSGSFVRFRQNQYGCDSTIWMNVTVLDSILPTVSIQEPEDKQGTGSITIGGKGYDYFYMNGERYDATHTYFTGYDGGIFTFEFFNDYGCSVLYTDTMNSECLQIQLGEVGLTCMGATEFEIPFTVDSGIPTTYTLLFDSVAHEAGFQDVVAQPYTKQDTALVVPIPAGATPYVYGARLEFHNILSDCPRQEFEVSLPLNFPSDLIFQRWGDVLSVYGTDYNGGYTFEGFQWFRDGQPIDGATRSYYYEEGGLDMDAEYQAQVTLSNGVKLYTCAFTPQPYQAPQQQPKKIIENQRLVIIYNGVRYNAQGNPIDKQ